MKHGRKPTVRQSIFIEEHGLNPMDWLVVKDNATEMLLVHRYSDKTTRRIAK